MFKQACFEKVGGIENKGSVLEYEYFGDMNKRRYAELVDKYKYPNEYIIKDDADVYRVMDRKDKLRMDYSESFKDDSFVNYIDAMAIVEKCQPGNPENPTVFFAAALRKELANLFGSEYKIKFFTAVGSHLDTKHGTDAFFKLYDQEDREISRATLDITGREKTNSHVDLIMNISSQERNIYDFDSETFDKDKFFERIKVEALKIKDIIYQNKGRVYERTSGRHPERRAKRPRIVKSV